MEVGFLLGLQSQLWSERSSVNPCELLQCEEPLHVHEL